MGQHVVMVVSTMNMTPSEVRSLRRGAQMAYTFGGNVCHLFHRETGINLEA